MTQSNDIHDDNPVNSMLINNVIQLWKKRRFIFWNTFGFAILSIAISLLLPKWYASSASIVSSGGSSSNFLSMLSGLPLGDFGLSGLSEDISNYIAVLESRDLREEIVKEFNLVKRYNSKDIEFAMQNLDDNVEIKVSEEGTLKITILDKDPVFARNMADKFIEELDKTNRKLSSEKGQFNREFLEERLNQNAIDLTNAEEKFKIFQKKYGLIDIPSQVTSAIETYALIYGKKVEAEIQYKVAKSTFSISDPKVQQLEQVNKEIDSLLDNMTSGRHDKNVLIAFNDLPELGLEYARLYREVELQSKILEFLLPQYEQAKMEETKNTPSLQIIDNPKVALNKSKPQRSLIVIGTTFMAFIVSIIFILFEYKTRELRGILKKT